ncbi:MAG: NB-ARC domain-containing protein, partial [Bacteroidota bacterium]
NELKEALKVSPVSSGKEEEKEEVGSVQDDASVTSSQRAQITGKAGKSGREVAGASGWGGVGKTIETLLFMQDEEVIAHYDAQYWLAFGENPSILSSLILLVQLMGIGFPDEFKHIKGEEYTIRFLGRHISDNIGGCKCLLVLDDVWNPVHLTQFFSGSEKFLNAFDLLVISRKERVIEKGLLLEATGIKVDVVDDDMAIVMIKSYLDIPCEEQPKWVDDNNFLNVLRKCRGLPLAIRMATAHYQSVKEYADR